MRIILGITLVLATFAPLTFSDIFADSFNVSFDKDSYHTGDALVISGQIIDFGMPVIAMSVFDPTGQILSANNLELSSDGSFSKTISLHSPFYEITGKYLVKLDYGKVTEEHTFVIEGDVVEPETAPQEDVVPEITSLYTEKDHYFDNDTIQIFGSVSSLDSPTVLIGIHDPFGSPAGFYFGNINNNLEFSTSFLVKDGVNFKSEGTYSIKAHYAETTTEHFFEYSANPPVSEEPVEDTAEETTETVEETIEETIEPTKTVKTTEQTEETIEPVDDVIDEIVSQKETVTNDDGETKTKIVSKETTKNNAPKDNILKNKEYDNLSVEDIELGKLLNQINLKCDTSTFVDTISYYDGMGPALYRLCQFDNSLEFFNKSLIENPDDVEILVNKGSTLGKLGYVSEAIAYYDHAIALDPNYLPAKNNKANALANLGNLDEAILLYNEILDYNPNYYTARTNLDTALSFKYENSESSEVINVSEYEIQNSFNEKSSFENTKEKPSNIFEELTRVFSSLFGFAE